jgi:hypothetical protein
MTALSERSVQMLQLPMRRSEGASRSRWIESLAVFVLFGGAFAALGCWLVLDRHLVTFDALDRLSGAYLAWHNDPPKLAAIGFAVPPLQTIPLLPFTIFRPLATSLVALPVCSALFGGATMVVLNRLLERCAMAHLLRYAVLVLLAATPTVCFYASAGGSELIELLPLAAAMASLVAWFLTVDTRYLIGAAMAFVLAVMAGYSSFAWLALAAVMVAVTLSRHHAGPDEVEGSLIAFLAPSAYAFSFWCLCNLLIVHSPFGWLSAATATSVNAAGAAGSGIGLAHALSGSLALAWATAPLLFVVIGALLVLAVRQRNELAGWLAGFGILALLSPGAGALIHNSATSLELSNAMPMLLITIVGAGWLYKSLPAARRAIGGGLLIGLAISIALVWHAFGSYRYQDLEQSFRATLSGQHASTSRGGLSVGIAQEQAMADYIDAHVHGTKPVLTDNAQTYAVILLSNRPASFSTRLDHGDGPWLSAVASPPRSVHYLLIARNDASDVIHRAYPGAVAGHRRGLKVVFANQRYALLAVSPGTTQSNSAPKSAKTTGARGGGALSINSISESP